MPRFVLLEHTRDGVHLDFMLEAGGALRTWAIDAPRLSEGDLPARRLADHRLAYLDYEGPVSLGRGEVRRLARGTYEVVSWDDDRVVVRLVSDQLDGVACVSRRERGEAPFEEGWVFRFGKVV